ncbi:MAG: hypothetical protein ACLVJ6_00120 [Merdibacter sp.]
MIRSIYHFLYQRADLQAALSAALWRRCRPSADAALRTSLRDFRYESWLRSQLRFERASVVDRRSGGLRPSSAELS